MVNVTDIQKALISNQLVNIKEIAHLHAKRLRTKI